jgi:hypothetical protein
MFEDFEYHLTLWRHGLELKYWAEGIPDEKIDDFIWEHWLAVTSACPDMRRFDHLIKVT